MEIIYLLHSVVESFCYRKNCWSKRMSKSTLNLAESISGFSNVKLIHYKWMLKITSSALADKKHRVV